MIGRSVEEVVEGGAGEEVVGELFGGGLTVGERRSRVSNSS